MDFSLHISLNLSKGDAGTNKRKTIARKTPIQDTIFLGDEKMCVQHSDCPSVVPLCVPGQYARAIASSPTDGTKNEDAFIGNSLR